MTVHNRVRKGLSPLISTVIIIAIVFTVAAAVSPWMYNLVTDVTNSTTHDTTSELQCRNAAYDFDTNYGTFGVSWNFSTTNNILSTRIRNTGTVNIYNFSFELTFNDTIIGYYYPTTSTQKFQSTPLKPGQTVFLNASFPEDVNDTLTDIKVMNVVCPNVFVTQEF